MNTDLAAERRASVLALVHHGLTAREIADELELSTTTVERDLRRLLSQLLAIENLRRGGNS